MSSLRKSVIKCVGSNLTICQKNSKHINDVVFQYHTDSIMAYDSGDYETEIKVFVFCPSCNSRCYINKVGVSKKAFERYNKYLAEKNVQNQDVENRKRKLLKELEDLENENSD